jgi:hypothetical protein
VTAADVAGRAGGCHSCERGDNLEKQAAATRLRIALVT